MAAFFIVPLSLVIAGAITSASEPETIAVGVPMQVCDPVNVISFLHEREAFISWDIIAGGKNCQFVVIISGCCTFETIYCKINVTKDVIVDNHVDFTVPLDYCQHLSFTPSSNSCLEGVTVSISYSDCKKGDISCRSPTIYIPQIKESKSVTVGEDGTITSNLSNEHCNILTSLTTVELCLNSSLNYGCFAPFESPYLELTHNNETNLIGLKSSVPLPAGTVVSVSCASLDCHDSLHKTVILNVRLLCTKERILKEKMLGSDAELLSVTVSVNELCALDTEYPVLVSFGTRPLAGNDSDCKGQVNTTVMTVTSGDSTTFSVAADAVSLGDKEEYCHTILNVDAETGSDSCPADTCDCMRSSETAVIVSGVVTITAAVTLILLAAIIFVMIIIIKYRRARTRYNPNLVAMELPGEHTYKSSRSYGVKRSNTQAYRTAGALRTTRNEPYVRQAKQRMTLH